jgi:aquacobalamin reductase/NAD(P)H-flavin reductase
MKTRCTVKSITPLADSVFKVLLQPQSEITYQAGQYLMVCMGEKDNRPFSIASSPCRENGELELHIGATKENAYAFEVMTLIRDAFAQQQTIEVSIPHGDASFQPSSRSILLIAGGTGFSYVRSIMDHCIKQQLPNDIHLYWGAREEEQLYALKELSEICSNSKQLTFVPVVEQANNEWVGKVGNVLEAVESDFSSLAEFDIYIAGRFEMAGSARERFTTTKEAKVENMYSDAFAFI